MAGKYDDLTRAQLVELLQKRDRTKKLGLVWERDEIEADRAMDANFVACRTVPELSDKPAPWDNLVIEGDNFDALRWLRMTHAGRVKCIYIDPPYNTGNKDWVYNDRYMNPEDRFRQSTWLEFLYRRLTLARDLLAEDGAMLVSINDENRARLELLMDEALPGMRIGSFAWRTKDTAADEGHYFSAVHEHILIYGGAKFRFGGLPLDDSKYQTDDGDSRGRFCPDPLTKSHTKEERSDTFYPIYDPATGWWYPCSTERVWAYSSRNNPPKKAIRTEFIEDLIEQNRIYFSAKEYITYDSLDSLLEAISSGEGPKDGHGNQLLRKDDPDIELWVGRKIGLGRPYKKSFWSEKTIRTKPISSWLDSRIMADDIDVEDLKVSRQKAGPTEIVRIFGGKVFPNAKPVELLRELVRVTTGSHDLVLDFFAGSATTGQAVMELNAEDGGNRRFIMVSSTEATEDDPNKNLCRDITAERIRRLNASDDPKYANLAAAFAYLRTHEIAFEDLDYDLTPADAWTALEAMHDLPLTPYDADRPWNLHEGEDVALVLVDRFDASLLDWLRDRERQNLFVYAWAPGQITQNLDGIHVDIRPVRETLVKRFQQ